MTTPIRLRPGPTAADALTLTMAIASLHAGRPGEFRVDVVTRWCEEGVTK